MPIQIRNALITDPAVLVRIRLFAQGGSNEALYEGLVRSIEEIIKTMLDDHAASSAVFRRRFANDLCA